MVGKPSLTQRLDDFGRGHPGLTIMALIALACVATIVLLASGEKTVVLYQAF